MNSSKISLERKNIAHQLTQTLTAVEAVKQLFEKEMGIDQTVVNQLLSTALRHGGDFADIHFEYSTRNSVVMEDGIIKNSAVAVVSGVGIRVVQNDQTGYAYSEDFDLKPMLHAARTAASIASSREVSLEEGFRFNELVPKNYYPIIETVTDLELTQKIEMVKRTEAFAKAYDDKINRVTVAMMDALNMTQVVTSDGDILRDTRPMFRMNVHCISQDGNNIQNGSSGIGGRVGLDYLKKADHAQILGKQAAAEAILLLDAVQAPSGLLPVILGPAQSGILLHEAVGHPLEADFNRKGTSAYSDRIGEMVASDLCSIYDSGTIENERGAINFDDEGIPSSENLLIEKGILRNYMHDRISAKHFRTNPTGNGRRESYAH
ncbi:MAG: TldD/PmbA family protein, partial [SAR324 cluster bacterium]|nr:TldD/PmbA family protein [SAR324 cluster bacterium]